MFITLQDRTTPERSAVVDEQTLPMVAGHWLAADGVLAGEPSNNVRALAKALQRGDWPAVHAIADHLSFSVDVIE